MQTLTAGNDMYIIGGANWATGQAENRMWVYDSVLQVRAETWARSRANVPHKTSFWAASNVKIWERSQMLVSRGFACLHTLQSFLCPIY